MPVQITFLFYSSLMFALALIVRWEAIRRRKGPSLKPGHLHQLKGPHISYTPPPDRSRRSLDTARR